MTIEQMIFSNLIGNEAYLRNVLPYLKSEYFSNHAERTLFQLIKEYFEKYNSPPQVEALRIEAENKTMSEGDFKEILQTLDGLNFIADDYDWLMKQTEKFCQDKAVYNAIMESIQIIDGKSDRDKGSLPQILQDALGVSFDSNIGHDFLEDFETRYDFYHCLLYTSPSPRDS